MKKQNRLTFASMMTITGAVIGLSGCSLTDEPQGTVYGPPPAESMIEENVSEPLPLVYGPPQYFEQDEEDDASESGTSDDAQDDAQTDAQTDADSDTDQSGVEADNSVVVIESGKIYEYFSADGSVSVRQDYNTNTSLIMDGEEGIPVDIAMGTYGPRIAKTDIDGDGEYEYLIAECEGTGSGMSVYGLCIVKKVDDEYVLTRYEGEYFTEFIKDRISYSYDEDTHEVTFTARNADGKTSFTMSIDREYSDEYELKEVVWSDIIRISLIDGKPYLSAPSGYVFADSPIPDYEDAALVSAPITVNADMSIEIGDITLGEDTGVKTP